MEDEAKERFFSEKFTPTTPQAWNKWYQDYRRIVLNLPKEIKSNFKKYKK